MFPCAIILALQVAVALPAMAPVEASVPRASAATKQEPSGEAGDSRGSEVDLATETEAGELTRAPALESRPGPPGSPRPEGLLPRLGNVRASPVTLDQPSRQQSPAGAQPATTRAATMMAACGARPSPSSTVPFKTGETLVYDLDIMGVRAGTLTLSVDQPTAGVMSFTASTRTNTFFANVRQVEGRATSFSRDASLTPSRYREDSTEDGVKKWAEVRFPMGRHEVDVRFGIGRRERRVRYPSTEDAFDLISLIYYLRAIDLEVGQEICFDVYANRRVWRLSGAVESEEFVRTPAGGYETIRVTAKAVRFDLPTSERDVHFWIARDEQRTPVAAMSVIDLGPVRARLTRDQREQPQREVRGGGRW